MVRVLYYCGCAGISETETRVEGFSGTLAELIKRLEELHGISFQAEGHDLLSALIFMINGRHIASAGGLDAPVSDGDAVSIFPFAGGG
ncbi:MAG: MoaD/ThiS family protein [Synergistaceae bacterium]|nr:MoaD/ThiS family protein [Synergistaceae bacterium]